VHTALAEARCCCQFVLLLQHGHLTATVSQQLKEQCNRSPQLWKELQQELTQELKAAKKDAKDARKGAHNGVCLWSLQCAVLFAHWPVCIVDAVVPGPLVAVR
jgi:hypothetical protein